jgi:hypothetical protein
MCTPYTKSILRKNSSSWKVTLVPKVMNLSELTDGEGDYCDFTCDVILNGGAAGARDSTTAGSFDRVDRNA